MAAFPPGWELPKISAESFIATLAVNIDNPNLSDAEFRQFCKNTLPIVKRAEN